MKTLSINRAATEIGRSRHKVKQWIDAGVLPAVEFPDGDIRIKRDVWEAFLRSLPETSAKTVKSLNLSNLKTGD